MGVNCYIGEMVGTKKKKKSTGGFPLTPYQKFLEEELKEMGIGVDTEDGDGIDYSKRVESKKGGREIGTRPYKKPTISKKEEKNTIKPRTKIVEVLVHDVDTGFLTKTKKPKTVVGTTSKGKSIQYEDFDKYDKELGGETIERTIHWYRMWFLFLKLGLEYQRKKIKVKNEYVKIDRRFYKEWSVGTIPNRTFDSWWKDHRHLFIQEQIKEIKKISEGKKQDYFHIRIPKHRNQREVLKEIGIFIQGRMEGDKPKYPFTDSRIQYLKLHQQYNCLILSRNGCSHKQIGWWITKYYSHINKLEKSYVGDTGVNQVISRVLSKGRDRLHGTSKGVFP